MPLPHVPNLKVFSPHLISLLFFGMLRFGLHFPAFHSLPLFIFPFLPLRSLGCLAQLVTSFGERRTTQISPAGLYHGFVEVMDKVSGISKHKSNHADDVPGTLLAFLDLVTLWDCVFRE